MATSDDAAASNRVVHRDVVCPFCSGACDDLQVTVVDGRVSVVEGGCESSHHSYLEDRDTDSIAVRVEQRTQTLNEAIERAADILLHARSPLIFGIEHLTCEAQTLAVSLAECVGATIDSISGFRLTARGAVTQQAGESTCTLGEMRDRADFVLLWDAVDASLPCQLAGQWFQHGSPVRHATEHTTRTVLEIEEADDGGMSDEALGGPRRRYSLRDGASFETICVMRSLLKGLPLDSAFVASATGVGLHHWRWLVERLRTCRYGVIIGAPADKHVECALNKFVVDLNEYTRFAYLNADVAAMNGMGADQVLTWRTGFPCAVNLAAGYPRFGPPEYSANQVLERGEADAALMFGVPATISSLAYEALARLPRIVLGDHLPKTEADEATVFIRTAQPGLHTAGTIIRFDGVPLPLRPLVSSPLPTAEQILCGLIARVRSANG